MEMSTMLQKVKICLCDHPETRNDDRLLTFSVWKLCGYDVEAKEGLICFNLTVDDFFKLPRPESISRARRIVQNELLLYPPTNEEILKKRGIKREELKEYFANREYMG